MFEKNFHKIFSETEINEIFDTKIKNRKKKHEFLLEFWDTF